MVENRKYMSVMQFRIADSFTDSPARLTGEEQKLVKTTAFDLQLTPANPGMQFHKLDKAKNKHFWSVHVGGGAPPTGHRRQAGCVAAGGDGCTDRRCPVAIRPSRCPTAFPDYE
jgi:hypothetical protein